MAKQTQKLSLKRLLPLLVILVVAVVGYLRFGDALSFATLSERHHELLAWRLENAAIAIVAFLLGYIAVVAFSLPGAAIFSLAGGYLFGLWFGTALNVTAATIGAMGIFLAAQLGLGDYLSEKMAEDEGRIGKIRKGIAANEVSYLLMMRLIPAVPFFVANLIPALIGVRFRTFAWTTFIGIIPGGFVYTSIGAGLGELLERGEKPDLGVIFEWPILLPILGLAALSALPIVIKGLSGRNRQK